MNELKENYYTTRDLGESAALIVMRRNIISINREGKICWFVFENKKRCEELSKQFFFDTLLVNAHDYYEALAKLKNRIFAGV